MSNRSHECQVFFRVNGGEIGLGHIKRCGSLAQEFSRRNISFNFCVNDLSLMKYLEDIEPNKAYCIKDENEFITLLKQEAKNAIVILDGYFANEEYIQQLHQQEISIKKVVVIDTLKRGGLGADILINPAPYALHYYDHQKDSAQYLLGPQYALLDNNYNEEIKYKPVEYVKNILVTLGGADPENITDYLVEQVIPNLKEYHFYVVIGPNSKLNVLKVMDNVTFINKVNSLKPYIRIVDFAISSGGTTLYELVKYNVPSLVFSQNESQKYATQWWEIYNCVLVPKNNREDKSYIVTYLRDILSNKEKLNEMKQSMEGIVNANGKERIVDAILLERGV